MAFPLEPPLEPMLAKLSSEIPEGDGWLYEPKWDGFRAIVFRDGRDLHIGSRKTQPLERYFPEVVETLLECIPRRSVVDGEIVIVSKDGLDFDALLQRIHPAESRIRMLAETTPASFIAFDLLALSSDIRQSPLDKRRKKLVASIKTADRCLVTPQSHDVEDAKRWFEEFEGAGLDGIVAKRIEQPYAHGERVMLKIKHKRTADCVVGGYRLSKDGTGVGSLLLGLYNSGVLHFVGHTSSFKADERKKLLQELKPLEQGDSFGRGRTPGGPSRWSAGQNKSWVALRPELVCEVAFDHLQGARFRHGTRLLRWRPDKSPRDCDFEQLIPPRPFSIDEIRRLASTSQG